MISYLDYFPENIFARTAGIVLSAQALTLAVRTPVVAVARWCGVMPPGTYSHLCWVPWRPAYRMWLGLQGRLEELQHGNRATGGFASTASVMTNPYEPGMVYLGRLRWWIFPALMPVGIKSNHSSLIVSKSRSGKSTHVIARLAEWKGNVLAFDIDGTFTYALARRLGKGGGSIVGQGGKFRCLDFNGRMKGFLKGSQWNVFHDIKAAVERARPSEGEKAINVAVRWADQIASSLIADDNQLQSFFADTSRAVVKAVILYVFVCEERKSLVRVRELLTIGLPERAKSGQDGMDALFAAMEAAPHFGGIIARGGAIARRGKTKDGRNTSLSSALTQTAWLDDPSLAEILDSSDFSLAELKTGDLSLSLIAPISDMADRLAPLYRLLMAAALYSAETIPDKPNQPDTIYFLDEWCAINMKELVHVPAQHLKYHVSCIFAAQQISQIRDVYGEDWETFFNNVDSITIGPTNAPSTLDYVVKELGERTVRVKVAPAMQGQKARDELRQVQVMTRDQAARFLAPGRGNVIVFIPGARPMKLKAGLYFRECAVWQVDADPQHPEKWPRAWARRLVASYLARQQARIAQSPARPQTAKHKT